MKKALFTICLTLLSINLSAQSEFKVEVRQVFPKKTTVYSNTFRFKREMESAISSQSAKYRGNKNNYNILIETPSGSETRPIQNIIWVETVNGVKTYHKKQTSPPSSYNLATNWQGYACSIDGSPKGTIRKEDFIYRVSLIGSSNEFETAFVSLANAKAEAQKIFTKNHVIDHLVEVVIYQFIGNEKTICDSLSNKKEYLAYNAKKRTADSLELVRKELLAITSHIEAFRREMAFVHDKKDSIKNEGVRLCRLALEETASIIPDSIFITEKLDSIYKSTLITDVLCKNKNKVIKGLLNELQTRENSNDSLETKNILLGYTKRIENTLFPPVQNEADFVDAYLKVIPAGTQPYTFELNGVTFSFYENKNKANESVLVNEQTKEYEVGTFELSRESDNKFIYNPKRVKKYSRDGKKI